MTAYLMGGCFLAFVIFIVWFSKMVNKGGKAQVEARWREKERLEAEEQKRRINSVSEMAREQDEEVQRQIDNSERPGGVRGFWLRDNK